MIIQLQIRKRKGPEIAYRGSPEKKIDPRKR